MVVTKFEHEVRKKKHSKKAYQNDDYT